ncbi:NAD(P)-binding protein [Cadophora sp. DSE1049]|nr:NAD(P)-binding protein [Cadophora sp. DSE1049]
MHQAGKIAKAYATSRHEPSQPRIEERIGAAIARNLASKGASIILNDTSDSSATQTTTFAKEIQSSYFVHCLPVQADIGHPDGPAYLIATAREHFQNLQDGSFQIDIIVNNAGIARFTGQPVYGGTNAALEAMTRTWARELAERCTVNAINPGPVKIDMWDRMPMEHRGGLWPWTSQSPLAAARECVGDEELVMDAGFVGGRPAYPAEIYGDCGDALYG